MSVGRFSLLAAALALLVIAPAAHAALPKAKDQRIVINSAIAGVKLGQSPAGAEAAWGKASNCVMQGGNGRCFYGVGAGETSAPNGVAFYSILLGKVANVGIQAGADSTGKRIFRGPLKAFKTSKRIGLGSTSKALRKAYKKRLKRSEGGYSIRGKRSLTGFEIARGRVVSITIAATSGF